MGRQQVDPQVWVTAQTVTNIVCSKCGVIGHADRRLNESEEIEAIRKHEHDRHMVLRP